MWVKKVLLCIVFFLRFSRKKKAPNNGKELVRNVKENEKSEAKEVKRCVHSIHIHKRHKRQN